MITEYRGELLFISYILNHAYSLTFTYNYLHNKRSCSFKDYWRNKLSLLSNIKNTFKEQWLWCVFEYKMYDDREGGFAIDQLSGTSGNTSGLSTLNHTCSWQLKTSFSTSVHKSIRRL